MATGQALVMGHQSSECYPGRVLHVACIPLFGFCLLHPKKGIGSSEVTKRHQKDPHRLLNRK